MSGEKIRVSFDEAYSAEVDRRLKDQAAVSRAQTHYAGANSATAAPPAAGSAGGGPASATDPASRGSRRILVLSFWGLAAGLLTWAATEIVRSQSLISSREEFANLVAFSDSLQRAWDRGELTRARYDAETRELERRGETNPFASTALDSSLTQEERRRRIGVLNSRANLWSFVWYAVAGVGLAASLGVLEPLQAGNPRAAVVNGSLGALLGLIGGLVAGACVDGVYRALGGGSTGASLLQQVAARSLGWTLLGAFLSLAPGAALRSPKRVIIGLAGGCVGGFLGGLAFDLVASNAFVGRLLGVASIGGATAAATGLIEAAAKTGWVHVAAGPIQGKQFILYRDSTTLGSSPQCEIYLFKDPRIAPRHAAIHAVPGGFELEDLASPSGVSVNGKRVTRVRLKSGDEIQLGGVRLTFGEREKAAHR